MRAPAFLALDRGACDGFRDGQQVIQIESGVPARVVFAIAHYENIRSALAETLDTLQGLLHFFLPADDTNFVLHHVLQIVFHLLRTLAAASLERFERPPRHLVYLLRIDVRCAMLLGKLGSEFARALAEDQKIGK